MGEIMKMLFARSAFGAQFARRAFGAISITALAATQAHAAPVLECRSPNPEWVHADVKLSPNAAGKYDVFFTYAVHAMDSTHPDPRLDPPLVIATNLACTFGAGLLVNCKKGPLEENENTNSFIVSTRRVESEVGDDGASVQREALWLSVHSPYTDAHLNQGPYISDGTLRINYQPANCRRTD
jgi:hypothetical protein